MNRIAVLSLALFIGAGIAFASPAHDRTKTIELIKASAGEDTVFLGNGELTYETFETSIEHVDLETCPGGFDTELVFCRLTLANDMAHVFIFDAEGDLSLLAVKSVETSVALAGF